MKIRPDRHIARISFTYMYISGLPQPIKTSNSKVVYYIDDFMIDDFIIKQFLVFLQW